MDYVALPRIHQRDAVLGPLGDHPGDRRPDGALQQDRAHDPAALPTGMILLYAVFFLLPFAICFALLSSRKVEFIAAGAGVACGFFGAFLVVSPYVLSVMALLLAMSAAWGKPSAEHALIAAGVALVAFLAANLGSARVGLQMDSHCFPLLERRGRL